MLFLSGGSHTHWKIHLSYSPMSSLKREKTDGVGMVGKCVLYEKNISHKISQKVAIWNHYSACENNKK